QVGFALDNARLLAGSASLQQQVDTEAQWTQFFTDAIQHIRASLKEEDILQAAVEEVRRVLECDRVLVYSREESSRGVVVAESVFPGWPRALGKTIKDPCFEARYDEQYQNGRVRAFENIYQAGLTSCYVEMLEKLAVKANLVAPILNEGKLLGLLVAHQCSEPRNWQQLEIRWFAQMAAQVGFALDNARLLASSNSLQQQAETEVQWTQFFTDAIQHIRASLEEEDVLKATVQEVRRVLECERVVVYSREANSRGIVVAESIAPGWPRALGQTIKDPCFEARYDEQYQNGRVRALENIYEAGLTPCYVEMLEKLAVKANLVAPILNQGKLLGLLVAHQCSAPRHWQQLEIRWFAQIAAQVGFALDNARLLANSDSLQQQADTEAQWTQFFTDAIGHIRASLEEKHVLQAAVEEVRKVLQCERVVVYSREENSRGLVLAESILPGWPRALGQTIKDPCFEAKYDEQYHNGRVRALDNIYEAGLTSCYIEMLEKLAVKANLVAPILNEGKLLGLLVAHQCSEPRNWQQLEIRWFAQIAAQVGFAIDNARLLGRVNQMSQQPLLMSGEHLQEQQLLQQLPKLLRENKTAVNTFSEEAQLQAETFKIVLEQIQGVADSTQSVVASAQQAEIQAQHTLETLQTGQEKVNQTVDNIADIQGTVKEATDKVKHLGNFPQKLSEIVSLINDLAAQLNQQGMNLVIRAGRSEGIDQNSMVLITETVRSSTQQLSTATAEIETLIAQIETEINQVAVAMDASTEQVFGGTELLLETQQQLDRIAGVTSQMNSLVEEIAAAAAQGAQNSTAVSNAVLELASFAKHTYEQSATVTESFSKLTTVVQELQADAAQFKEH
ncbi:MAG: GAF domain-containing protein, partial [Prochloraceae cyanobacterium]